MTVEYGTMPREWGTGVNYLILHRERSPQENAVQQKTADNGISASYKYSPRKRACFISIQVEIENFGSMTIPELRKELEKFGAKKSGRKRELVER